MRSLCVALLLSTQAFAAIDVSDIPGPPGTQYFGEVAFPLPNGNIVVLDSGFDAGGTSDVGAVFLYSPSGILISQVRGSSPGDLAGTTIWKTGAGYTIVAPSWDRPTALNAGAVLWCDQSNGCTGTISSTNALVGSTAGDGDALQYIPLASSAIVVWTGWDRGVTTDAGAITMLSGLAGLSGSVGASNSLLGDAPSAFLGTTGHHLPSGLRLIAAPNAYGRRGGVIMFRDIFPTGDLVPDIALIGAMPGDGEDLRVFGLSNGHYAALFPHLSVGGVKVGALRICDGISGSAGIVDPNTAIVGRSANDMEGPSKLFALHNGNALLHMPRWRNEGLPVGALMWIEGTPGSAGAAIPSRVLYGIRSEDLYVAKILELSNDDVIIAAPDFAPANLGLIRRIDGTVGAAGAISTFGITGSHTNDYLGDDLFVPALYDLNNGSALALCPRCDSGGLSDTGAAIWIPEDYLYVGAVGPATALMGSTPAEGYDMRVIVGPDHHAVVSPRWSRPGRPEAGAVTVIDSALGMVGEQTELNSLVGERAYDRLGSAGVFTTANGFGVTSPLWDLDPLHPDVGALTWCGTSCIGLATPANSLVGGNAYDQIGLGGAVRLGEKLLLISPMANVSAFQGGALSVIAPESLGPLGSGATLGGGTADRLGSSSKVALLGSAGALVWSDDVDFGGITDAGAVTFIPPDGSTGVVDTSNSVFGAVTGEGPFLGVFSTNTPGSLRGGYDASRGQVVLGRARSNRVTLLRLPVEDAIFASGFE